MRLRTPVLLLFILIAEPILAFAQKTIHGRVTDSLSGEGVPSAHVAIIGQRAGTITNDAGKYQLELPALPVKVRFSSIGYYSKEMDITADTPDSLDVPLAENLVVLEEIVVTDEDPAERIMREVIKRKQIWRAGLEKYTATGYSRVTLGNDKKRVMKVEGVLDVSWDKVRGFAKRQKAKRQTARPPQNSELSLSNLNLYDDDIKVLDQRVLGITHPDAFKSYSFKLVGQKKIDDKTVYTISVAPKNRYEKLLEGEISVLDGDFAMIGAKLRPNTSLKIPLDKQSRAALRKVFLPPPKVDMEVSFEQQFDDFGEGYWLPIGEKLEGTLDLGWKRLLALPEVRWVEVTRFTDFSVTAANRAGTPERIQPPKERPAAVQFQIKRGEVSIGIGSPKNGETGESNSAEKDSTAAAASDIADSTRIRDSDFIPPTMMIYTGSDSTTTMSKEAALEVFETFRPTGVIGEVISRQAEKGLKKEIEEEKKAKAAGRPNPPEKPRKLEKRGSRGVFDWSVLPIGSYNRVDGQNIGLRLKTTVKKRYTTEILGAYQTGRKKYIYDGGIHFPLGKQSRGTFELRASEGTASFSDSPVYPRFMNSVLTLIGNDDYFDYYHSIRQAARIKYTFPSHRIDVSGAVNREKHFSVAKTTDFNLLGRDITQRDNPPAEKGRLGSVAITVGYGDIAIPQMLGDMRRIELSFEYADPGLFAGDFSFRQYQVTADWRMKTFFRNGLEPNTLDMRIIGMISNGDLPVQRFGRIDSRMSPLTPYGVFRSRSSPLAGEQVCAFFWEHNFKTVPFEMLRLNFLAGRGTGIILHGASGRTWIGGGRLNRTAISSNYLDRFHHELGFSVDNIYAGLRVDVTKDLGRDTATWGLGYKRSF